MGVWTGSCPRAAELVAHIAACLTVADGCIREHETFDCYEPLPSEQGPTP